MAILPAYYNSYNTKKRKQTKSKSSVEHENWLKSQGLHISQLKAKNTVDSSWKTKYKEDLYVDRSDYVSAGMGGNSSSCADRSLMNNLHKEPEHVRKEILKKAKRVSVAYNKGPIMVITDNDDLTTMGRKI